jgi:hypothetical protein
VIIDADFNKATTSEVLMCGRNAYVTDEVGSKAYGKFILPAEEYKSQTHISFCQLEISQINRRCINDFINEVKNA